MKMRAQKVVSYSRTGLVLGQGKYGPVELIVYEKDHGFYALKSIPKASIDKRKRIEHMKNEKMIC